MALPPHRKVVFEDALDRPPKGSKAREVHFSDDINETGSSGTGSTGSLDQLQSIEGWLSAREHFRAVAAGFPRQLPLMTVKSCNHALVAYHETQVKPHIQDILKKNNLAYRTFELHRRRNPGVVESNEVALETLLIDTPSKDPTAWKVALMECANL